MMKWGIDDCLIDLFGKQAHKNISWVKESYQDTFYWMLSLSEDDRRRVWAATFEGHGYIRVEKAKPGDCAVGNFIMGVSQDFEMPKAWYAQYGVDHHWYIKLMNCRRVAEHTGDIEIFRWQSLQQH